MEGMMNMIYEFIYELWNMILIGLSSTINFKIIKEFILIIGLITIIVFIINHFYKKKDDGLYLYQKGNIIKIIVVVVIVIAINISIYKNFGKITSNNNNYLKLNGAITTNTNISLNKNKKDVYNLYENKSINYNTILNYGKEITTKNGNLKKIFYNLEMEEMPISIVEGKKIIDFKVFEISNGNLKKKLGKIKIKNIKQGKEKNETIISYTIQLPHKPETSMYKSDGKKTTTVISNNNVLLFSENDINNILYKSNMINKKNPFLININGKNLIHPFFIYHIVSHPNNYLPQIKENLNFKYSFLTMNFNGKAKGKIVSDKNHHLSIGYYDIISFQNFPKYLINKVGPDNIENAFFNEAGIALNKSNIQETINKNTINKINIIALLVSLLVKGLLFFLTFLSFMIYPVIVALNWQILKGLLE